MYYVYHTRFQPFSKLHEKELAWLIEKIDSDDKIIIGIINYFPKNQQQENHDWRRFDLKYNPLSYWERRKHIQSYIKRMGWQDKIECITPLPRPSTAATEDGMKRLNNYLPAKNKRVLCLPLLHDYDDYIQETKRDGLRIMGEAVREIPSYEFGIKYTVISSELVFGMLAISNYDSCQQFLDDDIISSLKALNIRTRLLSNGLDEEIAKNKLTNIYRQASNECNKYSDCSERQFLYNMLHNVINIDSPNPFPQSSAELHARDIVDVAIQKVILWVNINNASQNQATLSPETYGRLIEEFDSSYGKDDVARQRLEKAQTFLVTVRTNNYKVDAAKVKEFHTYIEGIARKIGKGESLENE